MERKITAIKCGNMEEYHQVQKKAFKENFGWCCNSNHSIEGFWNISNPYLFLYSDDRDITWGSRADDYIHASEYLNEGGKDVKEFEVGDRVDEYKGYMVPKYENLDDLKEVDNSDGGCDAPGYMCPNGSCGRCLIEEPELFQQYIKEQSTKPKTTKENNMSIIINNTVAKVFTDIPTAELVTTYLGGEYPEDNHRAYLDLKLNEKAVLAEAKRLEKEAESKK